MKQRRSLVGLTALAAAATLAACAATSQPTGQPTDPGPSQEPDATGAQYPEGTLEIELDADESFIAISPDGSSLVTGGEGTVEDADSPWISPICVRTAPAYDTPACTEVELHSAGQAGVSWSPDGTRLAYVQHLNGMGSGAVLLLDIDGPDVQLLVEPDDFHDRSGVLTWLDDDTLLYAKVSDELTSLHSLDAATGASEVLAEVDDAKVSWVQMTTAGPVVLADARGHKTLYRLDPQTGVLTETITANGNYEVSGIDPDGQFAVVQFLDNHHMPPPELWLLDGRGEVEVPNSGNDWYLSDYTFVPDVEGMLTLEVNADDEYRLSLVADGDTELLEAFPGGRGNYLYRGIHWTEQGIALPINPDGQPQSVVMVPATTAEGTAQSTGDETDPIAPCSC